MTDTEKKVRLTRFLREENMRNQIRVKNREEILYGSGKPLLSEEELPPVFDGHLEEMPIFTQTKTNKKSSSFGLRATAAVLIFVTVIYLDRSGTLLKEKSAGDWITEQLSWSAEGKLIDFVSVFPYTLSDE